MNEKMLNKGNQIHNFISSSGSGTVINYGSGSDFLTCYGSGSCSTSQEVTVPVPVPQRWPETRNSTDPFNLRVNHSRLEIRWNFFSVGVIESWNKKIPSDLKSETKNVVFRLKYKTLRALPLQREWTCERGEMRADRTFAERPYLGHGGLLYK
jgi:hypothetical protein